MNVFNQIAALCRLDPAFDLKKQGPAMRTRFNTLMSQFKADQCQSMRKSGTVEEYEEREVLLQNILNQIQDWNDKEAEEKERKTAKQRGIESSGALLRRLAMGEVAEDDDDEDLDDPSSPLEAIHDGGGPADQVASMAVPAESAAADVLTTSVTPQKCRDTENKSRSSGRKKKSPSESNLGL
ncbi:unnamed protein product [Phytophthora fragariaefolia]|uniref:Unnamed protein product n=1 Tax=Phytophthora fragariaefolia TaxID=1490495 RepID=A0A9W6YI00_9STRA|nr:unnamed protein product [Phytophthora fragariaefolia]